MGLLTVRVAIDDSMPIGVAIDALPCEAADHAIEYLRGNIHREALDPTH